MMEDQKPVELGKRSKEPEDAETSRFLKAIELDEEEQMEEVAEAPPSNDLL